MRPLVTCQKPAFRRLIMGLTGITDEALLPDTKIMSELLKLRYTSYVTMLTDLISKVSFICTTADIWSSNNKSYLGMTCHFLDEISFTRHSYVIGCRRIKGSHTYLNKAQVMNEITKTFKINNSKISHTVTDNASNFGKAFRTFSFHLQTPNESHLSAHSSTWFNTSDDESNVERSDSDGEFDNADVEVIDISTLFSNSTDCESNDDDDFCLPEHLTCTAHTLSLIATSDVAKISDTTYNKISRSVFTKLNAFWNILSRSSVASDKIYDICNAKFPVPIITRWNSMYFAVKKVITNKDKLLVAFDELKLNKLKQSEWAFLDEYCLIMEPLATSLDLMQGEKNCFLGYVAPTIIALRLKLIQSTHLIYCKPLVYSIIKSLEECFKYIFDLTHIKSKPFILSAISHPKFKLSWVPGRYLAVCKQLFITECNLQYAIENRTDENGSDDNENSDHEFYQILSGDSSLKNQISLQGSNNTSKNTNLASVQALSYLDTKKKEFEILNNLPIVKKVFLKYNTSLPSSAPVERLFSSGSQILVPRRNRLSDNTFEMLLCCRSLDK